MKLNYNGSDLPAGIGVLGWKVASPAVSPRALDVPGVRGRSRTGGKLGSRSVTIRMVISGDTAAARIAALDALNGWCHADAPKPLFLPGRDDRYLLAECDDYAAADPGEPGEEFDVSFVCHCPDYIAAVEQSAQGLIPVGGTVSTPVRLEQTLSDTLTDPVWTIDGATHTIRLMGEVDAGQLIIDSEKGAVTLDGVDISDQATLDSDLHFFLPPGNHVVTAPTGVTADVYWRNRWI